MRGLPKPTRLGQQFGFFNGVDWVVHPYLVWPTIQPSLTFGNVDGAIASLTISAGYSQAEVQALRAACETLADDVRAMRAILVNSGQVQGP